MSYQVLARKWRPRTFTELVGQEHVVQALSNALEQQRLHHAYLFTGTRGVGKTTLGRILAKALNCETGITSHPCGKCVACQEIDRGRFVDLLELDAASNTGIDNMREVLDNAQYAPTSGRFKVYLIDEVHMLSKAAFNSMLKTLEEPPEHVKFILATTDPQKIPVTVLSRCLQFNLKQMSAPAIVDHLQRILGEERIPFEGSALPLLARAAQGSMRDALSLTDQAIAHGSGQIGEADVLAMLGAVDQTYLFAMLDHLANGDGPAMIATAQGMAERSISFDAALQDMGVILHHLALARAVPDALGLDLPERARILDLANRFTPEDIQLYYQIAIHARKDLYLAPDEFAGFTMALIRMLAFSLEEGKSAAPVKPLQTRPAAQPMPASTKPELVASEPPAETDLKKNSFKGEWSHLVNGLKLSGMAKMLAQHCVLKSFADNQVELCVPEAHRHLAEKPYQEKLRFALEEYFGGPVRLAIEVGVITGMTPVEIQNRDRAAKQAQAVAAIETDPFVRELVENFDARIIDSSIKPIQ